MAEFIMTAFEYDEHEQKRQKRTQKHDDTPDWINSQPRNWRLSA